MQHEPNPLTPYFTEVNFTGQVIGLLIVNKSTEYNVELGQIKLTCLEVTIKLKFLKGTGMIWLPE